ncbi:lytic polysaccharide monooxygenase [Paenibacillus methanolicus]|uniref:Chitin-binding protein n=1 Tax=Paenibacillus methanolicus TaxID=582686 RepID=A0A5S5C1Q7_9BACL|nr:lytic polysaccharide monooxygenase [Paenibacillus methanolicus]TYP72366.1 chitin-binding protein [Paenibacillus methanolicus]
MTISLPNQLLWRKMALVGGSMLLMAVLSLILVQKASAHGYVDSPASRAIQCKNGTNVDCGAIVYEPQSLEAPKGWPNAGPADGKIASAGGAFPKLDEQSSTRWNKVNIQAGPKQFTWKLTAAHATASWKYYITKDGWNQNAPLTRDSFNLTPFCTELKNGTQPPFTYTSNCNVPAKSGYHVILAVWEIADTANAFYNVIDVNFTGGTTPTLGTPTGLTASGITNTSATLSWSAVSGATGYEIYRNNSLVGTSTTTSFTNTGLSSGTTYTYTVRATNGSGASNLSAALSVTTTGTSTPTYPAWSSSTVYVGGNKVSHNGKNYEAKWWTLGETPGVADVWKLLP